MIPVLSGVESKKYDKISVNRPRFIAAGGPAPITIAKKTVTYFILSRPVAHCVIRATSPAMLFYIIRGRCNCRAGAQVFAKGA